MRGNARSGGPGNFKLSQSFVKSDPGGGGKIEAAFAGGLGDADGAIAMALN